MTCLVIVVIGPKNLHCICRQNLRVVDSCHFKMPLLAQDMLQTEGLDRISRNILSFVAILDSWGAATWNLRWVAASSLACFLLIRATLRKRCGVDWYAFTHAIVSAYGAIMCTYVDLFASEPITGIAEPLRACVACAGPLTSLHRILPAITLGYSAFDFLDGLSISVDFALHGLATCFVMMYFVEAGAPQFVTPYLLMEVSTLNLTIVRADFFSDAVSAINQACFALSFFLFRIVLTPFMWLKLMLALYEYAPSEDFRNCYPRGLAVVSFLLGAVFHVLNCFWMFKIIRKAVRKLTGREGVKANNELNEEPLDSKKSQ